MHQKSTTTLVSSVFLWITVLICCCDSSPCTPYTDLLPSGFCSSYLQHLDIAQTQQQAEKGNSKLEKVYKVYLPLYASYQRTGEQTMKRLLKFYTTTACGRNTALVSRIIDALQLPTPRMLMKCANDIKPFVCALLHPVCMKVSICVDRQIIFPETCSVKEQAALQFDGL